MVLINFRSVYKSLVLIQTFELPRLVPSYLPALATGDQGEPTDRREAARMKGYDKFQHNLTISEVISQYKVGARNLGHTFLAISVLYACTWRERPPGGSRGSGPTGRVGRAISRRHRRPCGCRGRCSTGRTPLAYGDKSADIQ